MATFDGENLLITLDAVVAGVLDVDVGQDLYKQWKDWMLAGNMRYPAAFRTTGGDELTAIINAGSYFFLRNDYGWRIKSFENDGTYYLIGNLAVQDTSLPAFVATTGAYTAAILGLQPVTQGVTPVMGAQLEQAAFEGSVSLDFAGGESGTGYAADGNPIGTRLHPSNNLPDAHTILDGRGLAIFTVLSSLTLTTGDVSDGHKFIGNSPITVAITIDPSANVPNCEFTDMQITGTLDGNSVFRECIVGTVNYINGFIDHSVLNGTITLGGGANASLHGCWQQTGGSIPVIDMGGSGQQLSLADYKGRIKITNCTGVGNTYIECTGVVELDATIASGTFIIYGDCEIVNNTTGTAIVIDKTSSSLVWGEGRALTVGKFIGLK